MPGESTEIEDILLGARKRDEEIAKARANAHYAGEADPYKHPDEDDDDFDDDFDDDESDDADDPDDGYGDAVEVEEFDGSEESGSAA